MPCIHANLYLRTGRTQARLGREDSAAAPEQGSESESESVRDEPDDGSSVSGADCSERISRRAKLKFPYRGGPPLSPRCWFRTKRSCHYRIDAQAREAGILAGIFDMQFDD